MVPGSSAVEQPAVNRLVAGSNPARGASFFNSLPQTFPVLCVQNARPYAACSRATVRGRAELLTDAGAPAAPRKTQTSKRQDNTLGAPRRRRARRARTIPAQATYRAENLQANCLGGGAIVATAHPRGLRRSAEVFGRSVAQPLPFRATPRSIVELHPAPRRRSRRATLRSCALLIAVVSSHCEQAAADFPTGDVDDPPGTIIAFARAAKLRAPSDFFPKPEPYHGGGLGLSLRR